MNDTILRVLFYTFFILDLFVMFSCLIKGDNALKGVYGRVVYICIGYISIYVVFTIVYVIYRVIE